MINNFMNLFESMRDIQQAEAIWQAMSPLARYKLMDELPYESNVKQRTNACIRHIADNLDQYSKQSDV